MNPQLIADLEAARALIDSPEKCLFVGHAEDRDGLSVNNFNPKAKAFHPVSAMELVAFRECDSSFASEKECDDRWSNMIRAFREASGLERHTYGCEGSISYWLKQQGRTHAEVLAAFDRAIANERSKA